MAVMAERDTGVDDSAGPSRPAPRPTGPSKHHLEPNPFEQSFSSKPSDGQSASPTESNRSSKGRRKGENDKSKSDSKVKHEDGDEDRAAAEKGEGIGRRSNEPSSPPANGRTPSKRILPPVSSIASPAPHEANRLEYPWSSALTGSLRSGPLSPAMLAGPQSTFDVSNFRSGFTPDLSNFKTGLTPLGTSSGNAFPPPSPNTAAFLAMVTNGSGQGMSGITPNTLSALSGNPMDAHALASSQSGNHGKAQHHGEHHDQFDFAFGRSMQETPSKAGSKLRMSTMGAGSNGRDGSADFADSRAGHQEAGVVSQRQHQQQQQTTQAASGLFLLSQAHQELAKREDAAAAAAAITHPNYTNPSMNGQQLYDHNNGQGKATKGANNKRKKSSEPSSAQKAVPIKKVKVANKLEDFTAEEMGYESDEIDEEGNQRPKSSNGEGGDDEEKRKSFLERNRQAALKCRQRKKAWLASLQAKVEFLQSDNENLQGTCSALRNEVMFLKSQLMQTQRQMSGPNAMEGGGASSSNSSGPASAVGRNSNGGPIDQPSHQSTNNNISAMTPTTNNLGGGNRLGATSGQYQAHAVPRPTHIPGQPSNPSQYPSHPLQSSAQAA